MGYNPASRRRCCPRGRRRTRVRHLRNRRLRHLRLNRLVSSHSGHSYSWRFVYIRRSEDSNSPTERRPSFGVPARPHYTIIRSKTSFCSDTYGPKAHRPIYRDLGALVHSKYSYDSVGHPALIVALGHARHPQGPREQQSGAPDASGGNGMIITKPG